MSKSEEEAFRKLRGGSFSGVNNLTEQDLYNIILDVQEDIEQREKDFIIKSGNYKYRGIELTQCHRKAIAKAIWGRLNSQEVKG